MDPRRLSEAEEILSRLSLPGLPQAQAGCDHFAKAMQGTPGPEATGAAPEPDSFDFLQMSTASASAVDSWLCRGCAAPEVLGVSGFQGRGRKRSDRGSFGHSAALFRCQSAHVGKERRSPSSHPCRLPHQSGAYTEDWVVAATRLQHPLSLIPAESQLRGLCRCIRV